MLRPMARRDKRQAYAVEWTQGVYVTGFTDRRAQLGALAAILMLAGAAPCGPAGAAPAAVFAAPGDVFATSPARAAASAARLISAGPLAQGLYRAGVEIDLDPQTITYWRSPGEAGAPPVFDFSASTNVARVEVIYPAPKRIEEQGVFIAGYDSRVVFPLKVTPRDPAAPVTLNLSLQYSACGKICLPARASLSLTLPSSGVSPYAALISEADRKAPQKLDAAQTKKFLTLKKSAKDSWRLVWRGQGKAQAVFVEVADPLYVETIPEGDVFALKLYASGAKPGSVAAVVTVVTDTGAYEAPLALQ